MSESMPTIPTQSTFTYPDPNSSASPSFTQDDTSESFIPELTQPMPTFGTPGGTFTQTAFSQPAFSQPNQPIFSQPAVHFQSTQPTQPTNNVQSQQFQQFQTASISANNAKFPYLHMLFFNSNNLCGQHLDADLSYFADAELHHPDLRSTVVNVKAVFDAAIEVVQLILAQKEDDNIPK
ncbi:hypothetical protein Tco_1360993 [Tanacetum coccineum]